MSKICEICGSHAPSPPGTAGMGDWQHGKWCDSCYVDALGGVGIKIQSDAITNEDLLRAKEL